MAQINKNAIISITQGKATGFSRIRFNLPEEMRYTFPISDLFKMDIIGFNVEKIDFKEDQGKHLVLLTTSIIKSKMLNAIFTFAVHWEMYDKLKLIVKQEALSSDEDYALTQIKKVIETYPPIGSALIEYVVSVSFLNFLLTMDGPIPIENSKQ